jgi:predicted permease
VAEIALAVMLLVGATLLMRSFGKLQAQSPGFAPDHLVTASISIPAARYAEGAPREQFFGALLDRVRAQPSVASAALTQSVPMLGDFVSSFQIEGRPPVSSTDRPTTNFYAVSAGYFTAMRIPLLRGRDFSPDDRAGTAHVSVINETMAQHYFPGQNPLGHRINVSQGPSAWSEIVGVAADVKQYGLGDRTTNQVYQPYLQHPYFSAFSIVVRSTAPDPASVVPGLRNVVHGLDADVPLARVRILDQVITDSIKPQRFSAILIALFGGAALLLAAIGVYGVLSYTVGLRTQEFAIRMAHGADRSRILSLVLRGAVSVTAIGVGVGLFGAWLLRRLIESVLFGIGAGDVWTYALAGLTLSVVALVASVIPALRATRVEPSQALRA